MEFDARFRRETGYRRAAEKAEVSMAGLIGNRAMLNRLAVIQRIEIPEYDAEGIRHAISQMDLSKIAPNQNCSGFVGAVLTSAFDNRYCMPDILSAVRGEEGYEGAQDYDILFFYGKDGTVAKHVSIKVGDDSVGRNQGSLEECYLFRKPIADFVTEGFQIRHISAYDLMVECGERIEYGERVEEEPAGGCCCTVM